MDFQKKAEEGTQPTEAGRIWDYCLAFLREVHSDDIVDDGADPPSVIGAALEQAYKEGQKGKDLATVMAYEQGYKEAVDKLQAENLELDKICGQRQVRIYELEAEVERLRGLVLRMRDALESAEWAYVGLDCRRYCPLCDGKQDKGQHKTDCRIARGLAEADAILEGKDVPRL